MEIPLDATLSKPFSVARSNGLPDEALFPLSELAATDRISGAASNVRGLSGSTGDQDSKGCQKGNVDVPHRANTFLLVTFGDLSPRCAKIG